MDQPFLSGIIGIIKLQTGGLPHTDAVFHGALCTLGGATYTPMSFKVSTEQQESFLLPAQSDVVMLETSEGLLSKPVSTQSQNNSDQFCRVSSLLTALPLRFGDQTCCEQPG